MAERNRPSDLPDPKKQNDNSIPPLQDDDAIDLSGTASILEGSSGVIPLGELTAPGSSNAVFSWADIIGLPPSPSGEEGIKFDAISDKDLLKRIVEEEKAAGRVPPAFPANDVPEGTQPDLSIPPVPSPFDSIPPLQGGTSSIFPESGNTTGSSVSLDAPILSHGSTASGSVVKFDIVKPPSDAGGFMPRTTPDQSLPPVPPPELVTPTTFMIPPAPSGFDSDADLVGTPPAFNKPKGTDPDSVYWGLGNDQKNAEKGGSDIELGGQTPRSSSSASEHSSILDILLGDQEVSDAMKSQDAGKFEPNFLSDSGFGDGLGLKPSELQEGQGWAGGSLPTFLTPPSQPDFQIPDVENPTFLKPSSKPSTPSLPPTSPPVQPVKPGAAWLTPVSSEFDFPDIAGKSPKTAAPVVPPVPPKTPTPPPVPTFGGPPDFNDSTASGDSFNPEEAVDLISEGPVGTGISESGSLQISDADIEAANRRSRMLESSAIDLSSHPSIAGLDLDVPEDLPSFKPTPSMEDVPYPELKPGDSGYLTEDEGSVDLDLPGIGPDDSRVTSQQELRDSGFSEFATEIPSAGQPPRPARTTPMPPKRDYDDFSEAPAPKPIKRPKVEVSTGQIDIDSNELAATRSGKKGGWLVPGVLGLLLGAGTLGGAYLAGVLPSVGESSSAGGGQTKQIQQPPLVKDIAANPENAANLIAAGKLADALKAYDQMVEKEPKSPVALSGRGVARWQLHLQTMNLEGKGAGTKTEETSQAIQDLEDAYKAWAVEKPKTLEPAAIEAAVYRGQIHEVREEKNQALDLYDQASKDVSDDNKGVFQAHKSRLKVLERASKPAEKEIMKLDARELLPLVTLLQADPILKGSGELKEAGQGFWLALDLASEGKYAEAKNMLLAAIAKHKIERAKNPNKRLNPTTDPNEQIFEIACRELIEYWELKLKGPKAGPSKTDPTEIANLNQEIETLKKDKKRIETANKELVDANKTLAAKTDDASKEIATLTESVKTKDKMLLEYADVKKTVDKANEDKAKAETDLKVAQKQLVTLMETVKTNEKLLLEYGDAKKTVDAANEAKMKAEAALKTAEKDVAALMETVTAKEKKLLEFADVKKTVDLANEAKTKAEKALKESELQTEKLAGDLKKAVEESQAILKFVQGSANIAEKELDPAVKQLVKKYEELKNGNASPRERLDVLIQIVQVTENDIQAKQAYQDADKILAETKDDEFAAKATAIKAFAQGKLQNFVESRKLLEEVVKLQGFKATDSWGKSVTEALDLLKSPEKFAGFGPLNPSPANLKTELGKVERALKAFPKELYPTESAILIARRGAIKLDQNDPGALTDATAAIDGGAIAEGKLILARIAERKGDYVTAIKLFTEAQDAAKDKPDLSTDAMLGAVRSRLLQINGASSTTEKAPGDKQTRLRPAQALLLSVMLLDVELPNSPEVQKALSELDERIKNASSEEQKDQLKAEQSFLRALDQAKDPIKAREALGLYIEGLKLRKLVPQDHVQTLNTILVQIKKGPTTGSGTPFEPKTPTEPKKLVPPSTKSLELAEKFFNEGHRLYFHADYFGAEQAFLKSIAYADDARFYYFLALAQTAQGHAADGIFSRANELERLGQPEVKLINDSLERIQGPSRQTLELKRP